MNEDYGFSKSFQNEMKKDSSNIKRSNRKAFWGEILSYLYAIVEAIKNAIFYLSKFNIVELDPTFTIPALSFVSFFLFSSIIINYISVERILNENMLTRSNKLFILFQLSYFFYSNILLNFFILYKYFID